MSAGAAAGVSAAFGAPVGKNSATSPDQSTVQTCALLLICLSLKQQSVWLHAQTKDKETCEETLNCLFPEE